jgi:drug/metabolite transporter (DMT)-like permease
VNQKKLKPHFFSLLAMLIWGISYIWSKQVFEFLQPATTIWFRLIISVPFLAVIIKLRRKSFRFKKSHWPLLLGVSFFNPFLYFIGESFGLNLVSPTISAAIIATIPVFTPVFAFLFLRERIKTINILGLFISFAGVLIMLIERKSGITASVTGLAFLFMAVVAAIIYGVLLKKLTFSYGPIQIVFIQNLIGIFYFIPVVFGLESAGLSAIVFSTEWIIPLILLGVFASSLAFVTFTYGVEKLGIAYANSYTNTIPVFTAFFSFLLWGENLTFDKILGILLVVAGVLLSQRIRFRGKKSSI